ncbi:MAG: orotate phosphoribosyltransferase [Candidatus Eisenbacteria bacterium]
MSQQSNPSSSLTAAERSRLLQVIREVSLKRGHFVLSSGATSDYYLDLRLTTTDPDGARLAARALLAEAARLGATGVGGPTLGADPIVGATVGASAGSDHPVRGFLVRAAAKQHGTGRQIEGHLSPGQKVIILDDVVTSAGSLLKAVDAVREAGGEIVRAWCLVDRNGGGREALAEAGLELTAVFSVEEVLDDSSSGSEGAASGERTTPSTTSGPWPPVTPRITVDAILELVPGHVLLVERKHPPHGWALPGGFVEENESLEDAVRREIEEETSLQIARLQQLHTYSGPDRDPRFATATCVFVAAAHGEFHAGDDALRGRLFPLDALPADVVFDHAQIIQDFRSGRYGVSPGQIR